MKSWTSLLILVSGALGDVSAVECIKQGAMDYVLKDRLARLPVAVLSALQEKRLRDERQRAIDDLAKKVEELARSNRELEQFAYVASHDLQEPLRMVAAYTQLLAERYQGKLDEQADKYIHYAVDGAKRMQTLVQDLLAFSRAGRQQGEVKETDCNVMVELAIANLQDRRQVIVRDLRPTFPDRYVEIGNSELHHDVAVWFFQLAMLASGAGAGKSTRNTSL